jgi:hypothetical protein
MAPLLRGNLMLYYHFIQVVCYYYSTSSVTFKFVAFGYINVLVRFSR